MMQMCQNDHLFTGSGLTHRPETKLFGPRRYRPAENLLEAELPSGWKRLLGLESARAGFKGFAIAGLRVHNPGFKGSPFRVQGLRVRNPGLARVQPFKGLGSVPKQRREALCEALANCARGTSDEVPKQVR